MKLKFSWFFLLAFNYSAAFAAVDLPKEELVPGGIAIIKIAKRVPLKPEVYFNNKRVTLISDAENEQQWLALVGLPLRSNPGSQKINIKWSDKVKSSQMFSTAEKKYPESRITIKDHKKVEPGKKELDRIWREQKVTRAAKASRLENTPALDMQLPLQGRFSSGFGLKRFFNGIPKNPHGGLDIAAPSGTPIKAPAAGTVVATGDFFFSGNCVYIDHGLGVLSFYAHMTRIDVKKGQTVKKGEQLGTVGATGRVTGPHLHWSVGLNGTWVNPLLFVSESETELKKPASQTN